jgi:Permuted papain-like amidase enzyme, YaeF/YiiX, C92 family
VSTPDTTVEESSSIADMSDDGDIVLRSGGEPESRLIARLGRGRFSHAGICGRAEHHEVIDAYPREPSAVAKTTFELFFDRSHAGNGGGIYRYQGPLTKARAAARYAASLCEEHFVFDILDPILGRDGEVINNSRLYCSEFVWRCFRDGANVVLVAPEDFADFRSAENISNTAKVLGERELTERIGASARLVPSPMVRAMAEPKLRRFPHNGRFVTPDQLANSSHVSLIQCIPPFSSSKLE